VPQETRQQPQFITVGNVKERLGDFRARDNEQQIVSQAGRFVDMDFHLDFPIRPSATVGQERQ
jgi:hypothetical protein